MKKLTEKQLASLRKVEGKHYQGMWSYRLHDECDDGTSGKVWGVSVCFNDEALAYSSAPDADGYMLANVTLSKHVDVNDENLTVKALRKLNAMCRALWHRQPNIDLSPLS